jgi:FAD/FMN-containing dehydrogenase
MNLKTSDTDINAPALSDALIKQFVDIVGGANAICDAETMAPYLVEQRRLYTGKAVMVLRPNSTTQVSEILKLAHATGTIIVPQGGNTGLVGAQIPFMSGNEIIVQLGRMNKIRALDVDGNSMTVEAGVVLQTVQQTADENDRLFPLSLGAEGSCQIGGNLSTNAGGTAVLHYGSTRDLVLGLEVVLADGTIWQGLRSLRKNNTGYDLKHLFIGAEGTLGIITAATLKLYPKPKTRVAALVGLNSISDALTLLELTLSQAGGVTSFEFFPHFAMEIVLKHATDVRDPLEQKHPWYLLIELSSGEVEERVRDRLIEVLGLALERNLLSDAVVTSSESQRLSFWQIRTLISEVQKHEGASIKNDIAVPVSTIPEFLQRADEAVVAIAPDVRICAFGHLGDGNVHYNISQPVGMDAQDYLDLWGRMTDAVNQVALDLGGTISAEHGIGRQKRHHMAHIKSAVELEMMRSIKQLFDPTNILNPGKLL